MRVYKKNNSHLNAFTLVELSIILVIVGLLVGGVIAGQELVKEAKYRSATQQLMKFMNASKTYYLKYNNLPGDDPRATSFITGVTYNGDGNKQIRSTAAYATGRCLSPDINAGTENTIFWMHLSKAGLISGNYIGDIYYTNSYPESEITKGLYIMPICIDSGDQSYHSIQNIRTSHYFLISRSRANSYTTTNTRILYQIPPWSGNTYQTTLSEDAYQLDCKIDDCLPNKGDLMPIAGCNFNQSSYDLLTENCYSTLIYRFF
jgi:Tfp pilus assembly protein PilE